MVEPVIRPARRGDARAIARLFLISSDGLAEYIWRAAAGPGENPLDVGERRYARDGVPFSYQNCLVADAGGATVAMLHSFAMEPPDDDEVAIEPDPVLRPYTELEDYGSLYVSGLAVFDAYRDRGIGRALMAAAEDRARSLALPRVSLIVFERNDGAWRLYQRLGYREIDRRPIVPHPTLHYTDGDAILVSRAIA
jgi:ribosomal protein S18 acetylase RimI-like enzyme